MNNLFITGMPRSGTTLLDKLLTIKRCSIVYSQPLPLLFSAVKNQFNKRIGRESAYPMSDMFLSNYYDPGAWIEFLDSFPIDRVFYAGVQEKMRFFSGQYTAPVKAENLFLEKNAYVFIDFLRQYLKLLGVDGSELLGLKETWCEEYVPFFLRKNVKCVIIVRDPRDVVCSLNYGDGPKYGGKPKPLLFNIRSWRKSVAFCFAMETHPGFLSVRYEDLVRNPEPTLTRILEFLSISQANVSALLEDIRDQQGKKWSFNSSHEQLKRITDSSVGRYSALMPEEMVELIDACCFAEMKTLGYYSSLEQQDISDVLTGYEDSGDLQRPELIDYVWSNARRSEELRRFDLLLAREYEPACFLFERSFDKLLSALH